MEVRHYRAEMVRHRFTYSFYLCHSLELFSRASSKAHKKGFFFFFVLLAGFAAHLLLLGSGFIFTDAAGVGQWLGQACRGQLAADLQNQGGNSAIIFSEKA